MSAYATLLIVLLASGCTLAERSALRYEFPSLPLESNEVVVSVNAGVECDAALRWRPMVEGWAETAERDVDYSSIRVHFDDDVIDKSDFTSFAQSDGLLPALFVNRAGAGCELWAIEVEVGPIGWHPESWENDVLMLDYASHGVWHREERVFIE